MFVRTTLLRTVAETHPRSIGDLLALTDAALLPAGQRVAFGSEGTDPGFLGTVVRSFGATVAIRLDGSVDAIRVASADVEAIA